MDQKKNRQSPLTNQNKLSPVRLMKQHGFTHPAGLRVSEARIRLPKLVGTGLVKTGMPAPGQHIQPKQNGNAQRPPVQPRVETSRSHLHPGAVDQVLAQQKMPLIPSTGHTIQRSIRGRGGKKPPLENPYKKQYALNQPIKTSTREAARKSPHGRKAPQSKRLQKRMGVTGGRPNYIPPKDKTDKAIWDGRRSGLSWSNTIKLAMAPSKNNGCQINGPICNGVAVSIDHVTDFAELQSSIPQYLICDGKNHWKASYKDDAIGIYNNNDDTSNMVWSCTQCNSQKGGHKGLYENVPQWLRACPGTGVCTYTVRGEQL